MVTTYRETQLLGGFNGIGLRFQQLSARHDRDVERDSQFSSTMLQAHFANGIRRWADKDHAGVRDGFGKVGVLTEEAVAGNDGVDIVGTTDFQYLVADTNVRRCVHTL